MKWIKTAHRGLRYYEHETRKHGKRHDRYYSIRFKTGGKDHSFGVGWVSDGIPSSVLNANPGIGFEEYAMMQLRLYKQNSKEQSGPKSPKERRKIAEEKEARDQAEREQAEKESVTFGHYFDNTYLPTSKIGKKKGTYRKEAEHYNCWIKPVIEKTPLKDVKPFVVEKIKKNILNAGNTPRSLQYVFATIRQVWNMARRDGLVMGDSPTKLVKVPKIDNRRMRFLNRAEAEKLLNALGERDTATHNMALLSLYTGLRFGEIAALKWGHVDTERGLLTVLDTKSAEGRAAFMTAKVKAMLKAMKRRGPEDYVFTKADGNCLKEPPKHFPEVVKSLEFNNDITDTRQKVYFHTLRHTFASWHVEAGTDLYTLKELMGHSVIAMTERYAHLGNGTLRAATANLDKAIKRAV